MANLKDSLDGRAKPKSSDEVAEDERIMADEIAAEATAEAPSAKTTPNVNPAEPRRTGGRRAK